MSVGFVDPSALFGVGGESGGVDGLGGEQAIWAVSVTKLGQCSQMLA